MLDVETNHQIILLYFREGLSLRKIAQKLKIHRDTVKRHIGQYEEFKAAPATDQDKPRSVLNQYLKVGRVYNSENRTKRKLSAEILEIIDGCLHENDQKRMDGRIKQQLKKIDIHEKIISAGHRISYAVICAYIIPPKKVQRRSSNIWLLLPMAMARLKQFIKFSSRGVKRIGTPSLRRTTRSKKRLL